MSWVWVNGLGMEFSLLMLDLFAIGGLLLGVYLVIHGFRTVKNLL